MKKRGQKPNSKTYTIMLKGLSRVDPSPRLDPVKTALSIYRSITAENSAVRLNVIHTNAMIEVCTRQGDMNTLWRVAGGMPEEGNGSPDPFTYTAILRGIANSCRKEVEQMNPEDFNGIQEAKAKAIKEGKRVWADAIHQWVNGQPAIDGVVAQTMASLLLDGGTDQDCYHVFAMYSQITGIPIFARRPPPETPREKNETITPKQHIGAEETEDVPFVDGTGMPIEKHARKPDNYEEYMAENEETVDDVFDPISPNMAGNKPLPYLQVGNRELSTILEACMSMNQGAGAGKAYWQHLTQESNPDRVTPDPGSFDQYMRLLRLSRSSRAALELIRDEMVPAKLVDVVSFHIAFTCFLRDHRNINIFKISNELLEIMDRSVLSPDLRVLENYLKLVKILSENPHLLMSLNGLGLEGMGSSNLSLKGHYLQLRLKMAAATALRPFLHKLNEIMEHGIAPKKARGHQAKIVKKYGIQGAHALKFLNRVRLWMDEILSVPKPSPTSRNEWNQFKKDSDLLKKYSDAGMIKKYRDATVIPTDDQIMEFREKNGEAAV